jgi:hypothetical protein
MSVVSDGKPEFTNYSRDCLEETLPGLGYINSDHCPGQGTYCLPSCRFCVKRRKCDMGLCKSKK